MIDPNLVTIDDVVLVKHRQDEFINHDNGQDHAEYN